MGESDKNRKKVKNRTFQTKYHYGLIHLSIHSILVRQPNPDFPSYLDFRGKVFFRLFLVDKTLLYENPYDDI